MSYLSICLNQNQGIRTFALKSLEPSRSVTNIIIVETSNGLNTFDHSFHHVTISFTSSRNIQKPSKTIAKTLWKKKKKIPIKCDSGLGPESVQIQPFVSGHTPYLNLCAETRARIAQLVTGKAGILATQKLQLPSGSAWLSSHLDGCFRSQGFSAQMHQLSIVLRQHL